MKRFLHIMKKGKDFKLGFIGERGSGLRRLKPFLKEGFKNPKNFRKE